MGNYFTSYDCKRDEDNEKDAQTELWKAGGLVEFKGCLQLKFPGRGHHVGARPYHLAYFCIRANGELPRLILEVSGHPYVIDTYGVSFYVTEKQKLPTGRLPVLYDFDGKGTVLCQSDAIARFLAYKLGLAGASAESQALCDMYYETYKDLFKADIALSGAKFSIEALKSGDPNREELVRYREMRNRGVGEYSSFQRARAALQFFEDLLSDGPEVSFLCCGALTYVDLAVFTELLNLEDDGGMPNWAERLRLPRLKALKTHIESMEAMQTYLNSGRHMPRIGEGYRFVPSRYNRGPAPPPSSTADTEETHSVLDESMNSRITLEDDASSIADSHIADQSVGEVSVADVADVELRDEPHPPEEGAPVTPAKEYPWMGSGSEPSASPAREEA